MPVLLRRARVRRLPVRSAVPRPEEHFNAPLYTLKAFSIATAIVVTTASASLLGVMSYLDVHNTAEFAARMRTCVAQSMPLLTSKIYRPPTSRDTVDDDPVLSTASMRYESQTSATFDHDAAQLRLAVAFDKGGLEAWAEVAAREMEAEVQAELARKNNGRNR